MASELGQAQRQRNQTDTMLLPIKLAQADVLRDLFPNHRVASVTHLAAADAGMRARVMTRLQQTRGNACAQRMVFQTGWTIGASPVQRKEKQTTLSAPNVDNVWARVPLKKQTAINKDPDLRDKLNKNPVLREMLLMLYARIGTELWDHVKEISWISERGEMNLIPVNESKLQSALIARGYTSAYFARRGDNRWGLREPTFPTAGLHWRGLNSTYKDAAEVQVHIDLHPPLFTGFWHLFQDSFRRTKTHTPESIRAGIESLGIYIPVLYQQTLHGYITSELNMLANRVKIQSSPAAQAEIAKAREYLQAAGQILWAQRFIAQSELDVAMACLGFASAAISGAKHTQSNKIGSAPAQLQRHISNRAVQRLVAPRAGDGSFELDEATQARINRERGGGQPLDDTIRARFDAMTGR